jgi:hypothetical protein
MPKAKDVISPSQLVGKSEFFEGFSIKERRYER